MFRDAHFQSDIKTLYLIQSTSQKQIEFIITNQIFPWKYVKYNNCVSKADTKYWGATEFKNFKIINLNLVCGKIGVYVCFLTADKRIPH
jgi:hypothetical protein